MDQILGFWTNNIAKLFMGSGIGGFCAYFNLSQVNINSLTTALQVWQAILGIIGALVAITYGIYQIIRIHRQLKEKKK